MPISLLDQLPRLSAYDPGAAGEGGLDPMGLGSVADRIANVLAPGVRARMSLPRFVTISAVGAIAYQTLHELTADEGATTVDIAFEWMVVEALVRHADGKRTEGLPGNQKAARAFAVHERLSRRTYLNGARVFGFTGVYRPLSRDVRVLDTDGLPAENAVRLVRAWERDCGLDGYVDGIAGTPGSRLRREITDGCKSSLEKGECAPAVGGKLLRSLADCLRRREAEAQERKILRELITGGQHEIRNELCAVMKKAPPSDKATQRDLTHWLISVTSEPTRKALLAAFDYEEAATAVDNLFRRFLAFTVQQHGSVIKPSDALRTPGLVDLAPRIESLVHRAMASVASLGDPGLTGEAVQALQSFERNFTPVQLLDALIERHEQVQGNRKKLSWLDQFQGDWTVRTPYRNQSGDLRDDDWSHPMRLVTLAKFLVETA